MPKITLDDLTNLQNETSAVNTINNNSAAIEAAIENTLSRDGTSPNEMNANLDMNNYRVFNLPAATSPTEPIRKSEFDNLTADISNAGQYAQEAKDARDAAQVAEAGALAAETFAYLWASENEDTPVDDGTRTGYSSFHWSAKSEDHATDSENAKVEAQTARDFAHAWATEAEDVPVDDGVNPPGFSAYHWAQKAEEIIVGNLNASSIDYDNAVSGLTATNVQDAIDEVEGRVQVNEGILGTRGVLFTGNDAGDVPWTSTLWFQGVDNVQEALEESADYTEYVENETTLQEFVTGLTLSNNAGDPNNDIDIAPGRARGSGVTVEISSTITKRLDASWSEGDGEGGLDTGSKAANATYHVFVIRKDDDGTGDVLLSASATSPTVPVGWTRVQRLGAIMTDGSGNIRPFVQSGNRFFFNATDGVSDYLSAGARAKSALTLTVPNGVRVLVHILVYIHGGGADLQVIADVYDGMYTDIRTRQRTYSNSAVPSIGGEIWQYTNTSRQIQLALTSAHGSVQSSVNTIGWTDYQIPRIGA